MDLKQPKEKLEQADIVTQDDIDLYRTFNSTESSKRSLQHLRTMFFDTPFYNDGEQQPYGTFFHGGEKNVVGYILECLRRAKKQIQIEGAEVL